MIIILLVALGCVGAEDTNDILVRNASEPTTITPSGTFRGSWMTSRRGRQFQAYRGIRYAEPPVGDLRFEPPKPILQYEGIVDASEDGPACPQLTSPGYPVSEDCLTINVYTASNRTNLQPVIVYIHAGGLYSMSGRSDQAGPHYLLDKNIVLVTLNYRIGSLGFIALGKKEAPGNNGYKDQVVALRWVKRNIAAFGGNPELVTLTGCSAGGASVMLHMISPMSKGLFHGAISMSGSPIEKVSSPKHLTWLSEKQAGMVGCPVNDTRMIGCLKTKTWQELSGTLLRLFEFGYDPLKLWTAVVEPDFGQERFLPIDPMEAIRERKMHSVPFIIGLTRDEFFWKAFTVMNNATLLNKMQKDWNSVADIAFMLSFRNYSEAAFTHKHLKSAYFRNRELVNDTLNTEALGKLYADAIIGFSVHRMAFLMSNCSQHAVYYYLFNYTGNHSHYEDSVSKKPVGVAHLDDLIYLFTLKRFPMINVSDSEDSKMVDKMTTIWYNFARTGKPNPVAGSLETEENGVVTWPAMTPDNRTYLSIDKEFSLHEKLFENRFEVWEDFYRLKELPVPKSAAWCKSRVSSILFYVIVIEALYRVIRHNA